MQQLQKIPTLLQAHRLKALLLSGAIVALAFAPFNVWPIAIISTLVFQHLLDKAPSTKHAFLYGWLFGIGYFATGVSWVYVSIHTFGYAPIPLAVLLTALFVIGLGLLFTITSLLYKRLKTNTLSLINTLLFPAAWVINEWVRTWLLTGFPWLFLGFSQTDAPLMGYLPLVGTLGTSTLLVLTSSTMFFILSTPLIRKRLIASIALVWLAGIILQSKSWTTPTGDTLKVALVQANIDQATKWDPSFLNEIIARYEHLTRQSEDAELIIWPETALPVVYQRNKEYFTTLSEQIKETNKTLLLGTITEHDQKFYSAIAAIGKSEGIYHKQRLVPFGEYVPLEKWLRGLITFFDLPMSNFTKGQNQSSIITVNATREIKVAPFICYEIAYSDLVRSAAADANLLLTISNDAWFGKSIGPHQHMQIAKVRAIESGKVLLRGTSTGITAVVSPTGTQKALPQFKEQVLRESVELYEGKTPYQVVKNWPTTLFIILTMLSAFLIRHKSRKINYSSSVSSDS